MIVLSRTEMYVPIRIVHLHFGPLRTVLRQAAPGPPAATFFHSPHRTTRILACQNPSIDEAPARWHPQASQHPLSSRFMPLFSRTKGVPEFLHCPPFAAPPTHRQSHQEIWAAFPHLLEVPRWPPTPPSLGPNLAPLRRMRS